MSEESVFLLWYVKERDGDGADLLIGVYRTEPDAEAAIDRTQSKADSWMRRKVFQSTVTS